MNNHDQERIRKLLKESLPPIGSHVELRHDLWPSMLKRFETHSPAVPWYDLALLGAVAAWLTFFPGALPVLFYHL